MQNTTQDTNGNPLQTLLRKAGFKPATATVHNIVRVVLILIIISYIVYLAIKEDREEEMTLESVADIIKPGTILYRSAEEIDECSRGIFLKSIIPMLTPNPPTYLSFMKSIWYALLAGITSEYIVNGNTSKPMGVIAKTTFYTMLYGLIRD